VKLPKNVEADCLRLAGLAPAPESRTPRVELVAPSRPAPGVFVAAFEARPEANLRAWRGRHARAGAAWRAVREAVGPLSNLLMFEWWLSKGRPVRARFVRLGGKRLDPMVNLPSAVKGVEDAVCFLLGIGDESPLWVPSCDQEPGDLCGVRIELSTGDQP
jgi:hypothetical protein